MIPEQRTDGSQTRPTLRCDDLTFSDPYEYQQAILGATNEILVTQSGRFTAGLTRIQLHQLRILSGYDQLARIAYCASDRGLSPIGFPTNLQQAPYYLSGMEVSPGHIVSYAPGSEFYHRATFEVHWGSLELREEDLAVAVKAVAGIELNSPSAVRLMRPSPAVIFRLLRLHKAAAELATTAPEILTHPEVARAVEQELVQSMVHCLTGDIEAAGRPRAGGRASVMRRFEHAIAEAGTEPLYVAQVCAIVGVSDRTLRLHCLEHMGMAPHRYLWLRRMHLARRALALADARTTSVTRTANDHGFAELGRFAVTYRQLFGESPSVTLNRASDVPRPLSEIAWSPQPSERTLLPFLL